MFWRERQKFMIFWRFAANQISYLLVLRNREYNISIGLFSIPLKVIYGEIIIIIMHIALSANLFEILLIDPLEGWMSDCYHITMPL